MADQSEIEALAALYAAERADASGLSGMAINVLAMGLAYIAATLALLTADSPKVVEDAAWVWVLLLSPMPVLLLGAHWLSLTVATGTRAQSALALEGRLLQHIRHSDGSDKTVPNAYSVGVKASEPILNAHVASWAVKPGIALPFIGLFFLVVGHVAVMVYRADQVSKIGVWPPVVAAILYTGLLAILITMAISLNRKHKTDTTAAQATWSAATGLPEKPANNA